jgi:hypothetical protein
VRSLAPLAGKTVIFESSPNAIHGIPDPVQCPRGRARPSLASDYYTVSPGPGDRREPLLRRPKRPEDPWYLGLASVERRIVRDFLCRSAPSR